MHVHLVLPNQLYERQMTLAPKGLLPPQTDQLVFLEEPMFFYDAKHNRPYKIHRLKLAFLRASMRAFFDRAKRTLGNTSSANAKTKKHISVSYVSYDEADAYLRSLVKHPTTHVTLYDPMDHECIDKYKGLVGNAGNQWDTRWTVMDPPCPDAFLADRSTLDQFHRPSARHDAFYRMMKNKLDITVLKNIPSQDADNRQRMPEKVVQTVQALEKNSAPQQKSATKSKSKQLDSYRAEALRYVQEHPIFKTHYGELDPHVFAQIPITHAEARTALAQFVKERLTLFGPYQDAFDERFHVGYHSNLSASINVGLLTPQEVLTRVLQYAASKRTIPLNSLEGFVRQLVGWREYMRYIYVYHLDHVKTANRFGNNRRITFTGSPWYGNGEGLGIPALDREIQKALHTGYAHHIVRLMVFLNVMNLCHVHPHDCVQWFMEVVALDAYPWVMWSNIVAMGGFSNKFMQKPYLSTSNYASTMSGYPRSEVWDSLFYHRLSSHPIGGSYDRNLGYFKKLPTSAQKQMHAQAKHLIKTFTRPYPIHENQTTKK